MLEVTEDNFLLYAAANYENHYCLTEEEFKKDLEYLTTVRRMMSRLLNNEETNIKLLVNNIIILYNVFEKHALSNMIKLKVPEEHVEYYNAFLTYLNLPTIVPHNEININMFMRLKREFE